jgi:hypothetical protein
MAKSTVQSIEPNITELANSWLKSHKIDYKLEQESLNEEIDNALKKYESKCGGKGGNRPDVKLLIQDKNMKFYPVLIEYKGLKDKLEKLDSNGQVENTTVDGKPNFKNITSYAVNGAVHYANAILHYTNYTDVISIGMTGYKDREGHIKHEIGVYYVSKDNFGVGQKVGDFSDFSFLTSEFFEGFLEKAKHLNLSETDLANIKAQREKEIDDSLKQLNNDIYKKEHGLGENDRVYLVYASIIATLGVPSKVPVLDKKDLTSQSYSGGRDGDVIMKRVEAVLKAKGIPEESRDLIIRTLSNTILTENINKVENGESQVKRVFGKVVDDLGLYYKIGLNTDFTGKLFNEMYSWLGFSQDVANDVVLTPSYISALLVKLARINKDSFVLDFATGSAGLLVAAMNEMLIDAKKNISSPSELKQKETDIKTSQLLGLELIPSVYLLAVLNMILMGGGSSNILNQNSLKFNGMIGSGENSVKFPANAFILNPPYSEEGNGMVFVEKALSMMLKGYGAVIIQSSAGSGKAINYNKAILKSNTLVASIKMPIDIFIGKASVQTHIYVFKIGEKHEKDDVVKFVDFSNDGYKRTSRKKSKNNLQDSDHAKERYEELVNLVRFGKNKLNIFTDQEYHEGHIDPDNGADWNQSTPVNNTPILTDFKTTVSDYISWEVFNVLKESNNLGK